MFRIVQQGSESCELLSASGFVLVQVPVRITGEDQLQEANLRYRIGTFSGRETKLLLRAQLETTLSFRIPRELFHPGAGLALDVYAKGKEGKEKILWAKRYEAGWRGPAARLQPFVHVSQEPPGQM